MQIPGIRPETATAVIAAIGNGAAFQEGREFAAWMGVVPRECSTGGKQTLLTYSLALNPGFSMPGTGTILKSNTEKTMSALQTHIEARHRQSVTAANR